MSKLEELLQLIKEHPELPVIPMVDYAAEDAKEELK